MKNYSLVRSDKDWLIAEPQQDFEEQGYPSQSITYKLIGIAMEIHNYLGNGFAEVVYKDALVEEFKRQEIHYEREKKYIVEYKGVILPHHYFADFVVGENIILEVKSQAGIHEEAIPQVVNYLAASKLKVGLILNFGEASLKFKRVIFTRKKNEI